MPFDRPSLAELRERTAADLAGRLGLGRLLPKSKLRAIAEVEAGSAHEWHGHIEWAVRQILPDTADPEYLERHASRRRVYRKAATFSTGLVRFSGNDGTVVPVGTMVRRADRVEYSTTEDGTIAAGVADIPSTASVAGVTGNADVGTPLTLLAPVLGVAAAETGAGGLAGGTDAESDQALLARLLAVYRTPLMGGSVADYVAWALEVPGVTRAWCFPIPLGVSSVGVTFTVDEDPTGPIPSPAKVAEVLAYIQARRPMGAQVYVYAPLVFTLDLVIELDPDTAAIRASVEESLRDFLTRESEPGRVLSLSQIREAISGSPGEEDHVLLEPDENVDPGIGRLVQLGTISWV